ncbi:MAG: transglutaminase-like domain-containing protein [Candidatus Heimdallarchaeaceae archaeon]
MIKYSKKFMEKFGTDVHKAKLEIGFIKKVVYWIIDSKYRKSVRLSNWLNEQVNNIDPALLLIALSLKGKNNDETIINILKWVHRDIKYKSDKEVWEMSEKWQKAITTFDLKTGDCEDGAILIYVLARLANIPLSQITIAAGEVTGGGHAYCIYSADCDGRDRFIDWCYYYDSKQVRFRATHNKRYITEWFRFNEENSYKKVRT